MAYIERITTDEKLLQDTLTLFKKGCAIRHNEGLQNSLNARFSKKDIYGRAWFQMYEEFQAAGSILSAETQRGFATFYRGVAHIWKVRKDLAHERVSKGLIRSIEWEEVYNALDDTQNSHIVELAQREKNNIDVLFRQGVSYLHSTQLYSMQELYMLDELAPDYITQALVEFQQGMDIGLMRWRFLSTFG